MCQGNLIVKTVTNLMNIMKMIMICLNKKTKTNKKTKEQTKSTRDRGVFSISKD